MNYFNLLNNYVLVLKTASWKAPIYLMSLIHASNNYFHM